MVGIAEHCLGYGGIMRGQPGMAGDRGGHS